MLASSHLISEAMANARPISYAEIPEKPQTSEDKTLDGHVIAPLAVSRYRTDVKIYMLSTGDDPGSVCELKGSIRTNAGGQTDVKSIDEELPLKKNWSNENNGFGHLLATVSKETIFVPATFSGYLYEEGNIIQGDRVILNYKIDFGTTNFPWANGNSWWVKSWNIGDKRYACYFWWQVTQLA